MVARSILRLNGSAIAGSYRMSRVIQIRDGQGHACSRESAGRDCGGLGGRGRAGSDRDCHQNG